jgi:hypothetical protein
MGGLATLFGHHHEAHVHEWSQILNCGIVLIVHPATAEQFEAATAIMRRHCGTGVYTSPSSVATSLAPASSSAIAGGVSSPAPRRFATFGKHGPTAAASQ